MSPRIWMALAATLALAGCSGAASSDSEASEDPLVHGARWLSPIAEGSYHAIRGGDARLVVTNEGTTQRIVMTGAAEVLPDSRHTKQSAHDIDIDVLGDAEIGMDSITFRSGDYDRDGHPWDVTWTLRKFDAHSILAEGWYSCSSGCGSDLHVYTVQFQSDSYRGGRL